MTVLEHKLTVRTWKRRVFGRRAEIYFWTIFGLLVIVTVKAQPPWEWALVVGGILGAVGMGWTMLMSKRSVDERGTVAELRKLSRNGWLVRHDLKWRDRANYEHVVAGPAVYLLDSKNVSDSRVVIQGGHVRVDSLEDPDHGYTAHKWAPKARRAAWSLQRTLDAELGFDVQVHPVVVLWGKFEAGETWVGGVAFVRGERLADWLSGRPEDLQTPEQRSAVERAVRALARA